MRSGVATTLRRHVSIAAVIGLYLAVFFATVSDYGITWDSANGEMLVGDRCYAFLRTGDWRHLEFLSRLEFERRADYPRFPSGYPQLFAIHMPGLGPALTSAGAELFYGVLGWLDPIDAHHAVLGLLVAVQLVLLYAFALSTWGVAAALASVVFLATYPRYWADTHNDPKDIVEAVVFTAVVLLGHRAIRSGRALLFLIGSITWGFALAAKANAFFLPFVLAPSLLLALVAQVRGSEPRWRPLVWATLLVSPCVAFGTMLLAWPMLLVSFPVRVGEYLAFLRARGGSGPAHFQWEPWVDAVVTMPPALLPLLAIGVAHIVAEARRSREHRSLCLLLLAWLALPVLRVSVPYANDFDGIRHWIEFVPAACLIAGKGLHELLAAVARRFPAAIPTRVSQGALALTVSLGVLAPTLAWQVRAHPHQVVYYNALVGGLGGAQKLGLRGATDYWGSSYRQGLEWLSQHAEPRARLVVGVAQHIVVPVHHLYLRHDIEVREIATLKDLLDEPHATGRPLYLMYITRPAFYPEVMRALPLEGTVVHEITVDGGVILRIHRMR